MDFQWKVRRRRRLFERQNGLCHYCGGEMAWLDPYPKTGPFPDAMCTLEHLRDRFDPMRWERSRGEERTVAACYKCNTERSRNRAKSLYPPGGDLPPGGAAGRSEIERHGLSPISGRSVALHNHRLVVAEPVRLHTGLEGRAGVGQGSRDRPGHDCRSNCHVHQPRLAQDLPA